MKKDNDNSRQEEWNEQDESQQELINNPTIENAEKYREANNKVRSHYLDPDD